MGVGRSVVLRCGVKGAPTPVVSWRGKGLRMQRPKLCSSRVLACRHPWGAPREDVPFVVRRRGRGGQLRARCVCVCVCNRLPTFMFVCTGTPLRCIQGRYLGANARLAAWPQAHMQSAKSLLCAKWPVKKKKKKKKKKVLALIPLL